MRALFVDDEVERFKEYTWNNPRLETDYAKNPYHAQRLLVTFSYDIILLDHDMGTEMDGTGLARWMVSNPDIPKHVATLIVHSINADGRKRMFEILSEKFWTCDFPFAWKHQVYKKFTDSPSSLSKLAGVDARCRVCRTGGAKQQGAQLLREPW